MSDGAWYVTGATTPEIDVVQPAPGASVASPLAVTGRARAFEGNVVVTVHDDADGRILGEEPVTGSGGPDLGPFAGEIPFSPSGAGQGAVLFTIFSAHDGRVERLAAVPVVFGG